MTYRFTKYGLINFLWTLIPIFPAWTLFPIIGFQALLVKSGLGCEYSYLLLMWVSIVITVALIAYYLFRISKMLVKEEKATKKNFRWFSFLVYLFVNSAVFIIVLGAPLACNGDGQTVLVCIISGPITSVVMIILGFAVDLKLRPQYPQAMKQV
jgi:hypothetical protein